MTIDTPNINTSNINNIISNDSSSEAPYSQVSELSYILRDMTLNAVERFGRMNSIQHLSIQEKNFVNEFAVRFGIKGSFVNTTV